MKNRVKISIFRKNLLDDVCDGKLGLTLLNLLLLDLGLSLRAALSQKFRQNIQNGSFDGSSSASGIDVTHS